MPASFDLYLLPIVRQDGQDQPTWPGLYPAQPPRRAARGRDEDRLVLYLLLSGNAPLPVDQQLLLLEEIAKTYYKTAGTATAAMRAAAEMLNNYLLERNLRSSSTGRQSLGCLIQAVLRADMLWLAHSGPAHTYLIGADETRHYFDPLSSGRGLGASRQVGVRYFQATLHSNQFILLSHQPAAGWEDETLRASALKGLETMRRKLVSAPEVDFNGVLVQAQAGIGKLNLLRLKAGAQNMAQPSVSAVPAAVNVVAAPSAAASAAPPLDLPPAPALSDAPATPLPANPAPTLESAAPTLPSPPELLSSTAAAMRPERVPATQPPQDPTRTVGARSRTPAKEPKPAAKPLNAHFKPVAAQALLALKAFGRAILLALRQAGQAVFTLLRRILPDQSMLDISPSTLIFLTLAIPLAIGVVGAMVYVERGQARQYATYYEKAASLAVDARAQTDPAGLRNAWEGVISTLDRAENFRVTPESLKLRLEGRGILDQLDGVIRLDFLPAIVGGLPDTVIVSRILATPGELYMLDRSAGRVLRALLTGSGYELDTSFTCGPTLGAPYVGALIDLALLPTPIQDATLVAMDANGMLLLCGAGIVPLAQPLAQPKTNFGAPRAFDLNEGDLYVLDPTGNAVWIYRGMQTGVAPRLFFGEVIPTMADVIDLTVNKDKLYLLHSDGRQTRCTYTLNQGIDIPCQDPLPYTDRRPGRQGGAVIPDALFSQIYFSPPPDPSLYLLDSANQAIYHFGLELGFARQYRSNEKLPAGNATAFGLSPNRLIFLAVGSQVYYAILP